ncbi:MAG TPA: hypothetical protein VGQ83_32885 [Polyangia bacterium]|jgi:hypothetical protein
MTKPVPVLCIYRPKKGATARLHRLLARHWATLDAEGLVVGAPAQLLRCTDRDGRACFVEIFTWKSQRAKVLAHVAPAVMELWEPMGDLTDDIEIWLCEPLRAGARPRGRG